MDNLPWLTEDPEYFPPVDDALTDPDGLIAIGGDLTPTRLLNAYKHGIFPWFNEDQPILWWSPNPRTILNFDNFHISRSFKKFLKNHDYEVFFDRDFSAVISACQAPRSNQSGTWISDDMKIAYETLHQQGYAHSIEVELHGQLLGGLYGVSIGHAFFGESMFSKQVNGSKLALYFLIQKLSAWGFSWLDCQVWSEHLETLGCQEIPRTEFMKKLDAALAKRTYNSSWAANI